MSCSRFEELLERTMGLNAASIGASAVQRAVEARMRFWGANSECAYWDILQGSLAELQELIEAVIVPETWFFRDPQAFQVMVQLAAKLKEEIIARPLRLLSLPCSTGEEPYTMAIALLNGGFSANSFQIDAVDISARSLARAREGIFGRNSFRSRDLAFRDRYFEPVERGFRIGDAVRAPVHFHHGNILDHDFPGLAESYDVIFCRNLLIYFDAITQARAIATLKRRLSPSGMLFVGHSETGLMPANGLVSARIPMAFAFRQAVTQPDALPSFTTPACPPRKYKSGAAFRRTTQPHRSAAAARDRPPPGAKPVQSIEALQQMADCGRLDEAARGVEQHLDACGPSSAALLLLGLISDARGDAATAVGHYRKVLYLDPANHEALDHLSLLLKKQGDHHGAGLVADRRRRSDKRGMR